MKIPYDELAEAAVLGAALISPKALNDALTELGPADFYVPKHAAVFAAFESLWAKGSRQVDAVLVGNELQKLGEFHNVGGIAELIRLQSDTPVVNDIRGHVRVLQEEAVRRRMLHVSQELQRLSGQGKVDFSRAVQEAKNLVTQIELPVSGTEIPPDADQFLAQMERQDWLVDGLVERGDRIIITGAEGRAGKSTFLRQMAVQMAAGIHPFRLTTVDPIKVLMVDVENSAPLVRRKLQALRIAAGDRLDPGNLRIAMHSQGLDLTTIHDARWLVERVAAAKPDMIMIGPIYKLHADDPNEEQPARKVASLLDMIRERYGCSLMIEAHSPHGTTAKRNLRPYGASLWMRWPEFGYGLRPTSSDSNRFVLDPWRGPRDARDWPQYIRRGGEWPWSPA